MESLVMFILLAVIIVLVFVVLFLIVVLPENEGDIIDNSDGHVICNTTELPCIKPKIYPKANNCSDCPFKDEE